MGYARKNMWRVDAQLKMGNNPNQDAGGYAQNIEFTHDCLTSKLGEHNKQSEWKCNCQTDLSMTHSTLI